MTRLINAVLVGRANDLGISRAHLRPRLHVRVNQVLLLEAVQSRVNCARSDLAVESGLNASKNCAAIGFLSELPDSQQNCLLERTQQLSHNTYIVDNLAAVSIENSNPVLVRLLICWITPPAAAGKLLAGAMTKLLVNNNLVHERTISEPSR